MTVRFTSASASFLASSTLAAGDTGITASTPPTLVVLGAGGLTRGIDLLGALALSWDFYSLLGCTR